MNNWQTLLYLSAISAAGGRSSIDHGHDDRPIQRKLYDSPFTFTDANTCSDSCEDGRVGVEADSSRERQARRDYYDLLQQMHEGGWARYDPLHPITRIGTNPDDDGMPVASYEIRHLTTFLNFTRGPKNQKLIIDSGGRHVQTDAFAALMAVHHFNHRVADVVPQIGLVNTTCPSLKFTMDFVDTSLSPVMASSRFVHDVLPRLRSDYDPPSRGQYPPPTAIVGTGSSEVSAQLAILGSVYGLPQVSHAATSDRLDNKGQYPLFGRMIPSNAGDAAVGVEYLAERLGVRHLGILFLRDEYGTDYARNIQQLASERGMKTIGANFASTDRTQIRLALEQLKESDYRYFYGICFPDQWYILMEEASDLGLTGSGYFWLFGDAVRAELASFSIPSVSSSEEVGIAGHAVISVALPDDTAEAEGAKAFRRLWTEEVKDCKAVCNYDKKTPVREIPSDTPPGDIEGLATTVTGIPEITEDAIKDFLTVPPSPPILGIFAPQATGAATETSEMPTDIPKVGGDATENFHTIIPAPPIFGTTMTPEMDKDTVKIMVTAGDEIGDIVDNGGSFGNTDALQNVALADPFTYLMYDTIMALALASCKLVGESNGNFTGKEMYSKFLESDFEGAYGPVEIDPATGSRDRSTVRYAISNFVKVPSRDNATISFELVTTDVYGVDRGSSGQPGGTSAVAGTRWMKTSDFVFSDGSTNPPDDLPPPEYEVHGMGNYARAFCYALCFIVLLLSTSFALWTFLNRKTQVIRASQPIFLLMICGGAFMMGCAIVPMTLDEYILGMNQNGLDIACMAVPWCFSMGFVVCFSALISKMMRVNKLFNSESHARVTVSPRDVMKPIVSLTSITLGILISWTIVSPLTYQHVDTQSVDRYRRNIEAYGTCYSDVTSNAAIIFMICLLTIDTVALLFANYQSYLARNISVEYSESRYIAISQVIMLQPILVGTPILVFVSDSPLSMPIVQSLLLLVISCGVLLPIFLPKTIHMRQWRRKEVAKARQRKERMQRQHEFTARISPRAINETEDRSFQAELSLTPGLKIIQSSDSTSSLQVLRWPQNDDNVKGARCLPLEFKEHENSTKLSDNDECREIARLHSHSTPHPPKSYFQECLNDVC